MNEANKDMREEDIDLGNASKTRPALSAVSPSKTPEDAAAIAIALTHTSTLCDRVGFHVFVFAGGVVPAGWPCECGEIHMRNE